jgi:hypothetical protein
MALLHKKCDVCGTKINKLQSFWNIYTLKTGKKLICPKCSTEYKTNKVISFFGSLYTWGSVSIIVLIIFTSTLWNFLEKNLNIKIGIEVWLYALIILSILELFVMTIIPLKQVKNKDVGGNGGN